MYYVFVLFIGCYRANLQNILLLHLSEAAVSPVYQVLRVDGLLVGVSHMVFFLFPVICRRFIDIKFNV